MLVDVDMPLAEDSQRNILDALDNYCIQAILSRLVTRKDWLNAAETCTRFQANARMCFPSELSQISIGICIDDIPVHRLYSFLQIFGHMIEKIHWKARNGTADSKIFATIVRFCGRTLNELIIRDYNPKCLKRLHFKVLQKLTLDEASAGKFKYHSRLKYLRLINSADQPTRTKLALRMRRYPHLEHLVLKNIDTLTYDRFRHFLSLNPQLKTLDVTDCEHLEMSIFEEVGKYLPIIESFSFTHSCLRLMGRVPCWSHLHSSRNLRHLGMGYGIKLGDLIDQLVENDLPIEHLSLNSPFKQFLQNSYGTTFQTKSFKKMNIWATDSSRPLFILIRMQPSLEEIELTNFQVPITRDEIKDVFSYGKHLSKLSIIDVGMSLDFASDNQEMVLDCGRIIEFEVSSVEIEFITGDHKPTRTFTFGLPPKTTQS